MNTTFIIKLVHVLGVVFFAGGSMILSRVIASSKKESDEFKQALAKIVLRIYKIAVLPLMIVTVVTGFYMAVNLGSFKDPTHWIHIKLLFVLVLVAIDQMFFALLRKTAAGEIREKWAIYNMVHGMTGLAFLAILICVFVVRYSGGA